MKNNAIKSVGEKDKFVDTFPWGEKECAGFGIERQLASLAWNVLNGFPERKAISLAGLDPSTTEMWLISAKPAYLRAMRVMSAQYLTAVAFPISVGALLSITRDDAAPQAARVKAAGTLMEYSVSTIQSLKDELAKSDDVLSPEALANMIKTLETGTHDVMEHVHMPVQTAQQADYLSDMS